MKKIIVSTVAIITGLVSCDSWLDVNENPNRPQEVKNNLLIPSVEATLAGMVGGHLFNTAGFFVQYTEQAPEANQYNSLCENSFDNDLFTLPYMRFYALALEDAKVIMEQAAENEEWGDSFVATVLRAYIFQVIVDFIDQAPYSEALKGNEIPMPKWDSGESIYAGILNELDEAEARLNSASRVSADLILNKDLARWVQFANALRLRLYMRSSQAQDNSAKVRELIQQDNFFSGDIKFDVFVNESGRHNPWYSTNSFTLSATNHVGSYPIVSYLKITDDPRIADIFKKATGPSDYEGMIPGSKTMLSDKNDSYSFLTAYDRPTAPAYLYTQSELQFFLAEAYVRFFNDDAKAREAYESAIRSNFATTRGLADDPATIFGDNAPCAWSTATTPEARLKLIAMQKWVALCMVNNAEAWAEARRMNYPALSPHPANSINADATIYTAGDFIAPWVNAESGGKLVSRLYYPKTAVELNNNTPAQAGRTVPVWWDK
ncbi:MAG: SusD/RagB family nutrient-binding outer membrane lipoprotein [Tannerella sp.]|jgi:hypothetical protein|nr:SusD/RagB family nutrient-binding outer membrane lipoprotein [Tannerella sp.]